MSRVLLKLSFDEGTSREQWFELPMLIGKQAECSLQLRNWRVAKQHARLFIKASQLYLHDLGSLGGCLLNTQRVYHITPLNLHDQIIIGPCLIEVMQVEDTQHEQSVETTNQVHISEVAKDAAGDTTTSVEPAVVTATTAEVEAVEVTEPSAVQRMPKNLTEMMSNQRIVAQRNSLHRLLLEALDLKRNNITMLDDALLRQEASELLQKIIEEEPEFQDLPYAKELSQMVLDEAVGLGPLESLLDDPSITEIMVNRHDEIYIERQGRLEHYPMSFSSHQSVLSIIDRIVAPIGRRIDESSPMVDARLKDGSRVNAIIPPIALKGPCLTIRKFPTKRPTMQDLIQLGALDEHMSDFLNQCVKNRMNMIVSGGTGSGKTTLLNILSNAIPKGERIVTIEDAAELRLSHEHLVSLEARPANIENRGLVSIRDLVKNALRMRPDRIVVGECRGAEAFDMLSAMNTGHEGSLTTLHANSPRDALSRLELMILMAGMDLPLVAIREHIAASIDFIIQQRRNSDGRRVVSSIVEVCGIESGIIKTQEIFAFERGPQTGFRGLGIIPERFERLQREGFQFDLKGFSQTTHHERIGSATLH